VPVGIAPEAANRHDQTLLGETLGSIPIERPNPTSGPQGLCLDRAYDAPPTHELALEHGFTPPHPHARRVEGYLTANTYDDGSLGELFINDVGKEGSTLRGVLAMFAISSTPVTSSRSPSARPMRSTPSGCVSCWRPGCCARAWFLPSRFAHCAT
jgi:hypothetical protein